MTWQLALWSAVYKLLISLYCSTCQVQACYLFTHIIVTRRLCSQISVFIVTTESRCCIRFVEQTTWLVLPALNERHGLILHCMIAEGAFENAWHTSWLSIWMPRPVIFHKLDVLSGTICRLQVQRISACLERTPYEGFFCIGIKQHTSRDKCRKSCLRSFHAHTAIACHLG